MIIILITAGDYVGIFGQELRAQPFLSNYYKGWKSEFLLFTSNFKPILLHEYIVITVITVFGKPIKLCVQNCHNLFNLMEY